MSCARSLVKMVKIPSCFINDIRFNVWYLKICYLLVCEVFVLGYDGDVQSLKYFWKGCKPDFYSGSYEDSQSVNYT